MFLVESSPWTIFTMPTTMSSDQRQVALAGGEDGLLNIRRLPVELGFADISIASNPSLYYFAFAIYAVVVVALWRLVNSPYGKVLKAIKQNEQRVAFLGIGSGLNCLMMGWQW